jgi:hypothetical protein
MILNFKGGDEGLNASVYAELRKRIVTGHIAPDHELSTRGSRVNLALAKRPCAMRCRVCPPKAPSRSARSAACACRK